MGNRGQANSRALPRRALHGATKSLPAKWNLATRGITVNAVAPGIIVSPMSADAFPQDAIKQLVPMKRAGRPEEVANLVRFLASDEASYISGQIISVKRGNGVINQAGAQIADKICPRIVADDWCNDDITALIPAYNEVRTIRDLVERTLRQIRHVIVVDDGSTDGTAHALDGLDITLLQHATNQGKARSLWDGMQEARKRKITGIITLDGDGQHLPEDIPRLLQRFRQTPNMIVIGSRLHEKANIPRARYNANRFANFWIAWAAGYPIIDSQSGFRIYPANLLDRVEVAHKRSSCFVFESEILTEAGRLGITSVPIAISAIYMPNARAQPFPTRGRYRTHRPHAGVEIDIARFLFAGLAAQLAEEVNETPALRRWLHLLPWR